jgi:hypothetical protein
VKEKHLLDLKTSIVRWLATLQRGGTLQKTTETSLPPSLNDFARLPLWNAFMGSTALFILPVLPIPHPEGIQSR